MTKRKRKKVGGVNQLYLGECIGMMERKGRKRVV